MVSDLVAEIVGAFLGVGVGLFVGVYLARMRIRRALPPLLFTIRELRISKKLSPAAAQGCVMCVTRILGDVPESLRQSVAVSTRTRCSVCSLVVQVQLKGDIKACRTCGAHGANWSEDGLRATYPNASTERDD